ncbi:Dabb family protein [Flagellimonas sp. 2504JD4-2]
MKKPLLFLVFAFLLLFTSKSAMAEYRIPPEKVFCHTLFYQFSDSVKASEQQQFLDLFRQLPEKIEGLHTVVISNILTSSAKFDIMVTLKFSNKEGLQLYQEHEDHDSINALGEELIADYAYFRYWE